METTYTILMILGALFVGAASPGPSFVLVAKTTLSGAKSKGIASSLGMGAGGMVFSILSLLGIHAILLNAPELYIAFKIFGGMYLLWMGLKIFKNANKPLVLNEAILSGKSSLLKSFLQGFLTQISNPKTIVVYGSIFASLLPEHISYSVYYILPPLVFFVEFFWYFCVTLTLSTNRSQQIYLKSKVFFEYFASTILILISVSLIYTALMVS